MLEVDLGHLWNGDPLPAGAGGTTRLSTRQERLALSWTLRLPAPPRIPEGPASFRDGLWEFDVVELFLAPAALDAASPRYVEIECGVGGHWLALAFDGVRRRSAEPRDLAPLLINELPAGRWRGRAEIPLPPLQRLVGPPPWRGLVAAIMGGTSPAEDGQPLVLHACWPTLPGAAPDFHRPQDWAIVDPRGERFR